VTPVLWIVGGIAAAWLALAVLLLVASRGRAPAGDAIRRLPDTLRLVRRIASDRTIPWTARVPVWLLIGYLVLPIDLVPDVVPVIGFADDVLLTGVVLRHLLHRAGPEKLDEHWPGSPAGLAALRRALRLPSPPAEAPAT
jgi:uncharacterized membrane protein YkvA (DUF1232 family)